MTSSTTPARRPRRPRTGRVRAALALGSVALLGTTGTLAYWSDTVEVRGTTLTSGTLDLDVDGQDSVSGYADLTLAGMTPGNSTAGVLKVQNHGTVPLTYHVTSTSSDPTLTAQLVVKVTADTTVTGSGTAQTCAGAALQGSRSTFGGDLLASAAAPRTLQPGASQPLCLQATLSPTAPSSAQGLSTDVTLLVTGDQLR